MLGTKRTSKHWLVASMTRGARRVAVILSCLTLVVTLAFAGTLCRVESPASSIPTVALAQAAPAHEGAELIVDDAVPLAAGPGRRASVPTAIPLVGVLVVAGGYFALRIRRVDASIADMYGKVR